jgi:A/G-specific adenine glycosylase
MMQNSITKKLSLLKKYIQTKGLTPYAVRRFRTLVKEFYKESGRRRPWRKTKDPYKILVSEIMLQQTQVPRVCEKYPEFIKAFPTFKALAASPVKKLLSVWKGMGYNRRALSLKKTAQAVMEQYKGKLPSNEVKLVKLPGIGPATAADIRVFAFNKPALVIETNIRAVYIHLFFNDKEKVGDEKLKPLVEKTMNRKNPRDWYNGLMDLGGLIKKEYSNPAARSKHYVKQSKFEGSNRQMRSMILSYVMDNGSATAKNISKNLSIPLSRAQQNLKQMEKEGFIRESGEAYSVAE